MVDFAEVISSMNVPHKQNKLQYKFFGNCLMVVKLYLGIIALYQIMMFHMIKLSVECFFFAIDHGSKVLNKIRRNS